MQIKRDVYLLIEQIRQAAGSELQYHGYKLDRRLLWEKIGKELEQEIFDIYWNKEEMEFYELKESIERLKEIHFNVSTKNHEFVKKNEEDKQE